VPIAKGSKDIIKKSLDDLFKKKKQEIQKSETTADAEKPATDITEAKKAKL